MMAFNKIAYPFYLFTLILALGGCATQNSAPIVDGTRPGASNIAKPAIKSATPPAGAAKLRDWRPDSHTVQKGDTLYSIALEYGLDYRDLASWNGLSDNNMIHVGQVLKLSAPQPGSGIAQANTNESTVQTIPLKIEPLPQAQVATGAVLITQPKAVKLPYSAAALAQLEQGGTPQPAALPPATVGAASGVVPEPVPSAEKSPPAATAKESDDTGIDWIWPTQGRVIAGFDEAKNSKGLDIAGKAGQAIFAAASGKVVYSGAGLRGYGKLVIIKHNPIYLSAYAHNQLVLVKEGQMVTRGQKIAEMGDSDADQVELHFEIRQMGKPVDPMKYLPGAQK